MTEPTYYDWVWTCPDCKRSQALLDLPRALWRAEQQPPLRPEFDPERVECCGKVHEINRQNIKWVPVETV